MRNPVCEDLMNSQVLYLLVSKRSVWMGRAKKVSWRIVSRGLKDHAAYPGDVETGPSGAVKGPYRREPQGLQSQSQTPE